METKPIGLTKNTGYQVGARKTFDIELKEAWDFLLSKEGIKVWLGNIEDGGLPVDKEFETDSKIRGEITTFRTNSHFRMKWRKKEWENCSILQVRVISGNQGKTTISFHQEHLRNEAQRKEMKQHWNKRLDLIQNSLINNQ